MYQGFLQLGGAEIANAARVTRYVQTQLPGFPLTNKYPIDNLAFALGDEEYTSPLVDGADWVDPRQSVSFDFLGVYPLAIEGIENSTRTTPITESILDGGVAGMPRHTTREIRVRALLVGMTELGLDYGLSWLRAVLAQESCGIHDGECAVTDLSYLSAYPGDVSDCCYWPDSQAGADFWFGNVGVRQSPVVREMSQTDECSFMDVRWSVERWAPGTVVEFGVIDRATRKNRDVLGPVPIRRDNVIPNPTPYANMAGWSFSNAGATRQTSGGPGDAPYFAVNADGMKTFIRSVPVFAGNHPATLSFYYRLPVGEQMVVRVTSDGETVGEQQTDIEVASEWRRFTMPVGTGWANVITVESTGALDATMFMLETGDTVGDYFDMQNPPAPVAGFSYRMGSVNEGNGSFASAMWTGIDLAPTDEDYPFRYKSERTDGFTFLNVLSGWAYGVSAHNLLYDRITVEDQMHKYRRFMHDVEPLTGPTVIQRYSPNVGAMIEVEFFLNATTPFEFTAPRRAGSMTVSESDVVDPSCPEDAPLPLVDPNAPPIVLPPRPPVIPTNGLEDVGSWKRYWIEPPAPLPRDIAPLVPLWATSVPTFRLTTGDDPIRHARVRFYPNPFSRAPEEIDLCDFCGEFIVSYVPPNTELTVDGVSKRAWASINQVGTVPADHILYGSGSRAMSWPELSCGMDYLVTIDVPMDAAGPGFQMPEIDFTLTERS